MWDIYKKTKLEEVIKVPHGKAPIEYVHIFNKSYPRLTSVKLPKTPFSGEYENLLKRRKSSRNFSEEPVSLMKLSKILKSVTITDADRERRTYPSAGARYPVELYLIAFNIKGLRNGAYHFNIQNFFLEFLWGTDLRKDSQKFTSPFLKKPAGAIVLTGVLSRSYVKYKNKGYPFALIEAGHIAQNLMLSCAKYGLGICPIGGFVNDFVSDVLDLTGDELTLYTLGFGNIAQAKVK